jgi:hypothetical protein
MGGGGGALGGVGSFFSDSGSGGNNLLSSIPVYGALFDQSGKQGMGELERNQALWGGLGVPTQTWKDLDPQIYRPEMAQGHTVQDDPLVKSAQMSALAKMGDLSNTGLSDVDQAGYQQARDIGNQMANSGTQAAIQNANSRGLGGSGMEFAQREMANQQGAQRAQQAGLQQASDSARQRALYNQAYSNALGNQRAQDLNLNAQNAGILNQFNMANTNMQNQANQWNVNNQNQAQLANNNGRNAAMQANFNNALARTQGAAGANTGMGKGDFATNAANTANRNQYMQAAMKLGSMSGGGGGGGGGFGSAGGSDVDFGSYA